MNEDGHIWLSVIVPSLTGEVPQSLLEQVAGRPDVELVVVTGVSPVGRARGEGLSRATGDYIAWVDADDEVAPDWLSSVRSAIDPCSSENGQSRAKQSPDVVVIGHMWMMNAEFGFKKVWRGGDLLGDVLRQDVIFGELWNKVIRRSLWEDVRFDDAAHTMEDLEVLPQVLAKARRIVAIERPLYRYFARKNSLTHQTDEAMQRESFVRAVALIAEIKRLGLWEEYGRATMEGVGHAIYCCAETLALCGRSDSPTRHEAERWIRRRLPTLLATSARVAYKVKWILASLGWWGVVRWVYRRQGRDVQAR